MHVAHDSGHIAAHLGICHGEQRVGAVQERRARAERHKGIHIRCAVDEPFKAADEELLVDDHDDDGEEQLDEAHRDVVVFEKIRQRPAPHHMPHGDVHEHSQKADGRDETLFELWSFAVFQGIFCSNVGACAILCRTFFGRAVAGIFHGLDDTFRRSRALNAHGVREQADRAGRNARHLADRFFHTGAARRAAHTRDVILFHFLPFLS